MHAQNGQISPPIEAEHMFVLLDLVVTLRRENESLRREVTQLQEHLQNSSLALVAHSVNGHHQPHGLNNGNGNGHHHQPLIPKDLYPQPETEPLPAAVLSPEALLGQDWFSPDRTYEAALRHPITGKRLADVSMEGSLIDTRTIAGERRKIWMFRLLKGDLYHDWRRGKNLYLCLKNGAALRVRIAGMPSDAQVAGVLELV